MRKVYLDNIRWATVLLVVLYHVCYLFNGVGVPGGIPGAESIAAFDVAACVVYPWFMVLLFVIAGMSARYSLQKRTGRQFIRERAVKLLVPSTLGLFAVHWVTGYLNIKMGGGLAYIPAALVYPISAISGIGPLWFIQILFLFSCILVLLQWLDRGDRVWKLCGRAGLIPVLLLAVVIWGAAQLLNMPVLTMYRFGIYFAAFLIGYYVLSHEEIQNAIEAVHTPMLVAAAAGACAYAVYYRGWDYTAPACLQSIVTNVYLWIVVLAVLGNAKKYCNQETAVTKYLSANSFGVYVLHYPVLIVICYILQYHSSFSPGWKYLIAFALGTPADFMLHEVVKGIPVIRFVVLGQKEC